MHLHLPFTAVEILWTLTFASQLVLLVVLLGRDRSRRFPWFTASVAIIGLRLLAARLLYNRMAPLNLNAILITIADLDVIVGIMVLIELSRVGFRGAKRIGWIVAGLLLLAIAATVLALWGPWPAWKTLTANSRLALLLFMQLVAQKGELFVGLLAVQLTLLMALFGGRYKGGWRSHAQRILVGLSTIALSQIAVQAIWTIIVAHTRPNSREQYERVVGMHDKMINANAAVYVLVLIWWIYCLWIDEPGSGVAAAAPLAVPAPSEPAQALAPSAANVEDGQAEAQP